MTTEPGLVPGAPLLLGCGILAREIEWLARQNGWPLECQFLSPSLHIHLGQLARELQAALERSREREIIVFYGMCHPMLERILAPYQARQVGGENCVEMLLGRERYLAELAGGAFFLMEDWAMGWDSAILATFGGLGLAREIFQSSHTCLLGLRTPCSADFRAAAEAAARSVGLPLRWLDCGLEHLENVLRQSIPEAAWR